MKIQEKKAAILLKKKIDPSALMFSFAIGFKKFND
jgi:hypothetical protein